MLSFSQIQGLRDRAIDRRSIAQELDHIMDNCMTHSAMCADLEIYIGKLREWARWFDAVADAELANLQTTQQEAQRAT